MAEPNDTSSPKQGISRTPDFRATYANNVRFESSVWDLKLIFGVLDQTSDPAESKFHTSVNVPWMQAKIGVYTMLVNVLMHEKYYDTKIKVPRGLVPTPVEDVVSVLKEMPDYADTLQVIQGVHKALFGARDAGAAKKDSTDSSSE